MADQIAILTECGTTIGFGHLSRTISISSTFRNFGLDTRLFVATDLDDLRVEYDNIEICKWYNEIDKLLPFLEQCAFVLIDSYIVNIEQIEQIQNINSKVVIIDDFPRRPYSSGIVIDGTLGAENYAFPDKNPRVVYLLGSSFCVLRPEFQKNTARAFNSEPQSVLLTFGGSDIRNLTPALLSYLDQVFPKLTKDIVVGQGVTDRSFITRVQNDKINFYYSCSAPEMQILMEKCDIAVCGGGQTLYEMASQGLPPIVIGIIDNQADDIREFGKTGFSNFAGMWNSSCLFENISKIINELWSIDKRRTVSETGKNIVDGKGALRILENIQKHYHIRNIFFP